MHTHTHTHTHTPLHSALLQNACKNIYLYKMKWRTQDKMISASTVSFSRVLCCFCIHFRNGQIHCRNLQISLPGRKYFASCWSCFPVVGLRLRRTAFGIWKHRRGQKSPAVSWQKNLKQLYSLTCLAGGFIFYFYFHPYLGKWSNLTNIFQLGWNHQLEKGEYLLNTIVVTLLNPLWHMGE